MAKMRWPKRVGSLEGTYGVNWRQSSKAPITASVEVPYDRKEGRVLGVRGWSLLDNLMDHFL